MKEIPENIRRVLFTKGIVNIMPKSVKSVLVGKKFRKVSLDKVDKNL